MPTPSRPSHALRMLAFAFAAVTGTVLALAPCGAAAQDATEQLALDIHKELVEIDTTTATGDTLRAAQAMAARLRAGGFPQADVQVLSPAPRKGNLVARLRGTGSRRPMILMAHIDVVPALPQDWSTPPFQVVDKDGWRYGRGAIDDKAMAAIFVANLIRYRQEGYRPERDLILLLETDEEILDADKRGVRWLLENHRALIDAEFALNEGGGVGVLNGKPILNALQTGEKVSVSYRLEVRNPGGHSAQPTRDNAIYRLADGLAKLARHVFPFQLNETTRAYFERTAAIVEPALAADMRAILQPVPDPAALERMSAIPRYNAIMRSTCVATQLEGGHAYNALPQTARATINCRILPGEPLEAVPATLAQVLGDGQIAITQIGTATPSPASPLGAELLGAVERLSREFWPGAPVIPTMIAGATDGSFLRNAGIATYGHSGIASDLNDARTHGRDERISIRAYLDGLAYQYRLVKALSGPAP